MPAANFEGSCSIDEHFSNMQLIFNIDFCGTWAGPTFNSNTSCPVLDPANQWTSCNIYVGNNPQAFKEAYFAVNSIVIYQSAPAGVPTSSSMSSVTPAESTTSVSASGAEGRPTSSASDTSTSESVALSRAGPDQSSSVPPAPPPSPPPDTRSVAASTEVVIRTSTVVVTASPPHRSPLIQG